MKNLVVIATDTARHVDGYTTRILMELEKLKELYNLSLFIQGNGEIAVDYDSNIRIIGFPISNVKIRGITFLLNMRIFERTFEKYAEDGENTIVYAESLFPAIISRRIAKKKNNKFIYDCHGAQPDEYRLYHKGWINAVKAKLMELVELKIVKSSDLVVTVTNKQWEKWKVSGHHVVLPMTPSDIFLDTNNYREEKREELCIGQDEIVFVYSGRNQKWQMAEETVVAYKRISKNIPRARLVVLTPECEVFENILNQKEIHNAIVKSVSYSDMPKYLDACDYGFCLRSDSIINKVASPTKVLEYLSRGVKPILTEYVGEFSASLKEKGLAEIMDIKKAELNLDENSHKLFNGHDYVAGFIESVWSNYIEALKIVSK